MIRTGVVVLAFAALAACGKYGPPVRPSGTPPHTPAPAAAAPPVSSAPPDSNTEQCNDPNAVKPGAGP